MKKYSYCYKCAFSDYTGYPDLSCKLKKPVGTTDCDNYVGILCDSKETEYTLNKEKFCELMSNFVERYLAREDAIDKISSIIDINFEVFYQFDFSEMLVDFLSNVLDDKNGWLSYFVYEKKCCWFYYWEDERPFNVNSFEKLYDLITTGSVVVKP